MQSVEIWRVATSEPLSVLCINCICESVMLLNNVNNRHTTTAETSIWLFQHLARPLCEPLDASDLSFIRSISHRDYLNRWDVARVARASIFVTWRFRPTHGERLFIFYWCEAHHFHEKTWFLSAVRYQYVTNITRCSITSQWVVAIGEKYTVPKNETNLFDYSHLWKAPIDLCLIFWHTSQQRFILKHRLNVNIIFCQKL